jgi:hypothetical protein
MHRISFSILIALFFVLSGPLSAVFAQDSTPSAEIVTPVNLTVSPVTLQLETDPGKPVTSQIKIRNNSDTAENLTFSLLPFEADKNGDRPKMRDPRPDDMYLSWVSFDQKNVTVLPSEWKTVNFTFSPPADAALSYYFAVQIQRNTVPSKPGATVISGTPAVLVLATVHSPFAKREVRLRSFTTAGSFLEFLPQTFSIDIENTGNIHVTPTGNIFIDGQGKKDLAVLSLNPNISTVLPSSSRAFHVEWNDGFPKFVTEEKEHTKQLKFDFSQADRLRFGRYTAHLLLVYDNGERDVPIESYVSFWVVPVRLIVAAILIPAVPALLVYILMKWQYARMKRKLESETEKV